jgi:hypothetical protein
MIVLSLSTSLPTKPTIRGYVGTDLRLCPCAEDPVFVVESLEMICSAFEDATCVWSMSFPPPDLCNIGALWLKPSFFVGAVVSFDIVPARYKILLQEITMRVPKRPRKIVEE